MVLGGILLVLSCGDGAVEPAPPPAPVATTLTVSPASATLSALGETARLTADVRDQNGQVMAGVTVAWASSDASVAGVDASGLVTAAANGSVTVTATSGSVSGTATVTVAQVVSVVEVSPASDTLVAFGDTVRLVAEAADANGHAVAGAEFFWSSSDTLVARVDDLGLVESLAEGAALVSAMASDVTGAADLSVVPPLPTTIMVSTDTLRFTALGQTAQLAVEVRDQVGRVMTDASATWSSGDTLVAVVDSVGLATAVGEGTATVTAAAGEVSDAVTVTVTQSAGSVVVSPAEGRIGVGDTLQLVAEAFDENGHAVDGAMFSWSSSDAGVARVGDAGLVEGVAEGTARITAAAGNAVGVSEITVENPDRAALVALYNATDGPNWADSENWLTDAPLEDWYGVYTHGSGRVVQLSLSGHWGDEPEPVPHGLNGPIPAEIGTLTKLRTLDLTYNHLEGAIPPELGNLASLTRLGLGFNNLTGPIPPELGNLSKLEQLWLGPNQLAGAIPPELGNLASLTSLILETNDLTGSIPSEFGNLSNLEELILGDNQLTGAILPALGNLSNLRLLSLNWNRLTGPIPSELGNLSNLERLWLHDNDLFGPVPPELGALSALEILILSFNRHLAGPLPATFTGLTELWNLQFIETELCAPQTTEFREWLRGVADVFGDECPVVQGSDRDALAAIHEWTNGDGWRSSTNWLSEEPLDSWYGVTADSTDRVTALDLSDNSLAGILPDEAGDLLNLETLTLNGNDKLAGELPGRIRQIAFLSTLRLDGTGLCASTAAFATWLDRIPDARVTACPDDHGNEAAGATSIPLGERTGGEIESLSDEDWFRVEIRERGTLTVSAEGDISVTGQLYGADGSLAGYDGSTGNFSIVRRLSPGTYYVRVAGETENTRGAYTLASSFEPRKPGARAYLTQAVQSHDFAVPLVAGEDALLRVFVMADSGVTASMPPVLATFHRGSQEVHSVRIDGSSRRVPETMAEGDLDATANAVVPGSVLVPGTEMVVEIDPDRTLDASLGIGGRIPEEGRLALDVRSMSLFDVTAVPFLWTEDPDSSGYKEAIGLTADHDVFYETRDWLPVADMEVTVREPVLVDYDPKENLGRVLDDTELLRVAEGASGYYMGVPPWIEAGTLGIALLDGKSSVSRLDGHTVAHEFGHNFSLRHTPCGNPAGVDGRYPHSGGRIGAWGYNFANGTLVDPETYTDLMTYCRANDWISDYSFAKSVDYRSEATGAAAVARRVLVLRGGVAEGRLKIEPAFVLDAQPTLPERSGPYRLVGSDVNGGELFALRFDLRKFADSNDETAAGFTFAIPTQAAWADALAAVTLTGPEGSVSLLAEDSASPATTLLLDGTTGRIRAILRESSAQAIVAADGTGRIQSSGITLISRGLPDPEAWRR